MAYSFRPHVFLVGDVALGKYEMTPLLPNLVDSDTAIGSSDTTAVINGV